MVKSYKFLVIMMTVLLSLVAVNADPITVESVNVQEVSGKYVATVQFANANTSSGTSATASFAIEGVSSNEAVLVESSTSTQTFELKEVLSNYDSLNSGNTYTLSVSVDGTTASESFLFGSVLEETGLAISYDSIKVNGVAVNDYSSISVNNGETLTVDISFLGLKREDNARFRVEIDGYEQGVITDSTDLFLVRKDVADTKTLQVRLPSDMDSQQRYVLRVYGSNDLAGVSVKEYDLYVDTQRHRVDISDLVMSPQTGVEPGQAVISNVRVTNRGQKVQDSVKVVIEVPELNIVASSYVSNLDLDESITSEDMYLGVPSNANPGVYTANVYTQYNDGYTESKASFDFVVLAPVKVPQRIIMDTNFDGELVAGKTTTFDIVVANPSSESQAISIVPTEMVWAKVKVTPSFGMIQAGTDRSYTVEVTPTKDATGTQNLLLVVKNEDAAIDSLSYSVTLEEAEDKKSGLSLGLSLLQFLLIGLIVLLIIILLIIFVALLRKKSNDSEDDYSSDDEHDSADEYY